MKKSTLIFLSVLALVFVIGSACAWSNGSIGFGQLCIQVAIGVAVEWFTLKEMNK